MTRARPVPRPTPVGVPSGAPVRAPLCAPVAAATRAAPHPAVAAALLASLLALAACSNAPPSRATAERLCEPEARLADGIAGNARIGTGTGGPSAGGSLTITSDILNPRDEAQALQSCIDRRLAGQPAPRGGGLTVGITLGGDL